MSFATWAAQVCMQGWLQPLPCGPDVRFRCSLFFVSSTPCSTAGLRTRHRLTRRCCGAVPVTTITWKHLSSCTVRLMSPGMRVLQELCRVLAELHDRAPVHGWEASRKEIEAAFGRPVDELFDEIDHAPLASGSIAQARRCTALRCRNSLHHYLCSAAHVQWHNIERRSTMFTVCMGGYAFKSLLRHDENCACAGNAVPANA